MNAAPPRVDRTGLRQLIALWGVLPRTVRRFAGDFAAVFAEEGRELPARVALYQPGEPHLADCVVRVSVDGNSLYDDKLKYPEARERGIHRDPGGFYYLDFVSC